MLDKTLFKALRAGGLGHRAAQLLADKVGEYSLTATTADLDESTVLNLALGGSTVAITYGRLNVRRLDVPPVLLPLQASSVLELTHSKAKIDGTTYPDLSILMLSMVKLADVNGIPVAPALSQHVGTRAGGTVALPSALSGFTYAHTSSAARGFTVTVATAGHYLVSALSGVSA